MSRLLSFTWLVLLSVSSDGSQLANLANAAESDRLFPVGVNYDDDFEWTNIAPSEAVRLVDDAAVRQPSYGSARGRLLIYVANQFVSNRDAMIELFGELERTDDPGTLREKTAPILRLRPQDIIQKWNWSEITITEDGNDVIEKTEKWSNKTQSSASLSTEEIKIIYDGMMGQADVALPGLQNRMHVNRLASFHIAVKPAEEQSVVSAAKTSSYVRIVRGSGGVPGRTTIFSVRDGSVLHDYSTSPDGALVNEAWQGATQDWAGGVRYPTSFLYFRYADGAVTYVKAVAVKHVEFNVRVDPGEFAIRIPSGTTVVDVREGDPAVVRVIRPIGDLKSALDDGLHTQVRPATNPADATSTFGRKFLLILVNVVVVAVLIVLVLVVRWRAARSA